MYDPVMAKLHPTANIPPPAWKMMAAGAICGAMGALACNPFELVKTRLQSAAPGAIAVGHQHGYTGVWMAIRTITGKQGLIGLYQGSGMSVVRSIVGSGANLSAFHGIKRKLMEAGWQDAVPADTISGLLSGLASVLVMNPVDVLRTRFYNQPSGVDGKGLLYKSGWHCAHTVVHHEGYRALYKGFLSHFLRIGPHFCFTFLILGVLRRTLLDWHGSTVNHPAVGTSLPTATSSTQS
jgi:solute carrier family 25 protein 34/35